MLDKKTARASRHSQKQKKKPGAVLFYGILILAAVLFLASLIKGGLTTPLLFYIPLVFPDWLLLIALAVLLLHFFYKPRPAARQETGKPLAQENLTAVAETPVESDAVTRPQPTATVNLPENLVSTYPPLPAFLQEVCSNCGRKALPGTSICSHCANKLP